MSNSLVDRFTEELRQYPPMGGSGHVYTILEQVWGDSVSYRLAIDGKPSIHLGSLWHLARFRRGYLAAVDQGSREAPYKVVTLRGLRGRAAFPESVAERVWLEGHDLATGNDSQIDPTGASSYCNLSVYPVRRSR